MKILGLFVVALVAFGLGRTYEKTQLAAHDSQTVSSPTASRQPSGVPLLSSVPAPPPANIYEEYFPPEPSFGVSAPVESVVATTDLNPAADAVELPVPPRNTALVLSETLRLLGAN